MSDDHEQEQGPEQEEMPVSESLAEAEPQVELAAAPTMATPPVEPVAPPPLPGAPAVAYAPPASNGFAVAALVLGIVALVMFFTVWLPILLGALAIVFGALGISKANKMGGRQKGLAIAGLVCGAAAIVIGILFVVVIVNVFNDPTFQDVFSSVMQSPTR